MNTVAVVFDPVAAGRAIDAVWEKREAVERKRADYDDTLLKLLLEAKANYSGPFKEFVEKFTHISLTTAKRTLRIADGRGEEVRQAERARQQRSRAAKGVTVTPRNPVPDLTNAEFEKHVADAMTSAKSEAPPVSVRITFKGNRNGRNHRKLLAICERHCARLDEIDFTTVRFFRNHGYALVAENAADAFIADVKGAAFGAERHAPEPDEVTPEFYTLLVPTTTAPSLVPATTPPEKSGDLQSYLDLLAEYQQLGARLHKLAKDLPMSIDDARKFIETWEAIPYEVTMEAAVADIGRRVDDADKVVGLTKEAKTAAKDPDRYLQKARESEQDTYMADDRDEAKRDARDGGESWSDQKEQWEADWIADNWDDEREAEFKRDFLAQWERDHGKPFPDSMCGK
jgi:hypothetical protein